jgi:hypothetical protein
MTNTLRMTMQDGTVREIALTDRRPDAAAPVCAIAYIPHHERILVDDDGHISVHDARGIPQTHDAAA